MFDIGVIPAAGAGLRLHPYTVNTPKALCEIGGKSLLLRNIEIMRDQLQVHRIIVIVGHFGDQIRQSIGDGSAHGVAIEYIECSDVDAGLAKGLCLVRDRIHGNFPVILGDELYLDSNHDQLKQYADMDIDVVCGVKITGDTTLIRKNYGLVIEDGKIISLDEKPEIVTNNYLGCGSYVFSTGIFSAIDNANPSPKTHKIELTDVINQIAHTGGNVCAAILKGDYRNINFPDDFNSAMNLIRKKHFSEYKVSLVIPAYNEETGIGHVIDEFRGLVDEIVVAENCSADRTAEIARAKGANVISQNFRGYGQALKAAMDHATGDMLVLMEADASFTADDLPKILEYMKDADMVLGTRTTKQMIEQGANMDTFLRLGNVFAAKVLQLLWVHKAPRFTDLGCTYRGIWRDTYLLVRDNLSADGPEFSPEMMVELLRANRKIIEIPVTYRPRIGDVSKHSATKVAILKTGCRMMWLIFKRRLGFR